MPKVNSSSNKKPSSNSSERAGARSSPTSSRTRSKPAKKAASQAARSKASSKSSKQLAPGHGKRGRDKKLRKRGSGRRTAVPFISDPSRVPWDRQPDETDKAWAAFIVYRDMGAQRSIESTARQLQKKTSQHIGGWSRHNGWRFRVEEYDRDSDRKLREEAERVRLEGVEQQTREMLTVARAMWTLAGLDLQLWHEKLNTHRKKAAAEMAKGDDGEVVEPLLSAIEIKNLADAGMKMQRLLEDKPTEIADVRAKMTIDDRRRRLQRGLGDPDVRDAMRVVAEKLGTADAGSG